MGLGFLVIVLLTKGFGFFGSKSTDLTDTSPKIDSSISISLSEITDNARWYEYDFERKEIRFFAVRAGDGSVKTAFDACDVCYTSKKGYRQEEDYMVCNNCGNRYPINGLGTENKIPGGCWPGHLSNVVEGDNVIIKKSDLEDNQWRSL